MPTVSLTPFAKHEHLLSQEDKDILKPSAPLAERVNQALKRFDSSKMRDRLERDGKQSSVTVYIPVETDIPCIEDQLALSKKRPRQPSSSQSSQTSEEDSLNSPKFEYALVKTIESPQGDFKLKMI